MFQVFFELRDFGKPLLGKKGFIKAPLYNVYFLRIKLRAAICEKAQFLKNPHNRYALCNI